MSNCHLSLLSANEFWEVDADAGILRRKVRGPKSLRPHLTVIVDDLVRAYVKGVATIDSSIPPGIDGREFRCRVCLLFWTGDYPAQAAVSGTHSKTCHWCEKQSFYAEGTNRSIWNQYRQYLPQGHPMRRASARHGPVVTEAAPQLRTHHKFVTDGQKNEDFLFKLKDPDARRRGIFKYNLPAKKTGIKMVSPLAELSHFYCFDMVWDILPDMMHVMKVIWPSHVFEMMQVGKFLHLA
jgi:hypothetical protein